MRGTEGTASLPYNCILRAGPHFSAAPATWMIRRSVTYLFRYHFPFLSLSNSLYLPFFSGRACTSFRREHHLDPHRLLAALCVSRITSRRQTWAVATLRSFASAPTAGSFARRTVTVCVCWRSTSTAASWWTACPCGRLCCGRSAPYTLTATWCSRQSSRPLTVS